MHKSIQPEKKTDLWRNTCQAISVSLEIQVGNNCCSRVLLLLKVEWWCLMHQGKWNLLSAALEVKATITPGSYFRYVLRPVRTTGVLQLHLTTKCLSWFHMSFLEWFYIYISFLKQFQGINHSHCFTRKCLCLEHLNGDGIKSVSKKKKIKNYHMICRKHYLNFAVNTSTAAAVVMKV